MSKEQPVVFTEVGLHGDVEITLDWSGETPLIYIGHDSHTMLCFADAESLDRLAAVAADGARQLRERIKAYKRPPSASGADSSGGVEVA